MQSGRPAAGGPPLLESGAGRPPPPLRGLAGCRRAAGRQASPPHFLLGRALGAALPNLCGRPGPGAAWRAWLPQPGSPQPTPNAPSSGVAGQGTGDSFPPAERLPPLLASPAALPSPDFPRLSLLPQTSPGPALRSDALGKTCQGRVNNTLGSDLKDAKLTHSSALMQNAGWQRCCIPSPNPILERRVWDCCYFFFPFLDDAKL